MGDARGNENERLDTREEDGDQSGFNTLQSAGTRDKNHSNGKNEHEELKTQPATQVFASTNLDEVQGSCLTDASSAGGTSKLTKDDNNLPEIHLIARKDAEVEVDERPGGQRRAGIYGAGRAEEAELCDASAKGGVSFEEGSRRKVSSVSKGGQHFAKRVTDDPFSIGLLTEQAPQQKGHHHLPSKRVNPGRASIVGGVIVPTIIHNDKMDEIETYDIIYRQPASSRAESSSSSSEDDRRFSSDSEQEDDRVERLSNEFEDRVKREKSELRAKVDQIMSDIKISSKSDKNKAMTSGSDRVNFVLGSGSSEDASGKVAKSLSSSGNSSASSTCTSISSQTLSCSRTGSASTSKTGGSSPPLSSGSSSSSTCSTTLNARGVKRDEETSKVAKRQGKGNPTTSISEIANLLVSKNTYGQTYLHFIASKAQNSSTFYKVLNHGSYLIGERDAFYRTARDIAVQFNLSNNVQVLDKFIIDLFIDGNISLLRHLLNQGYSPLIHVADFDGNDIMLILKLLKLDRMVLFLLQMADFQRWRDELHTFIRHGYSAGVCELVRKHKDLVVAKSVYSRTSLHLAVLFDRVEMVDELLRSEPSSVNQTDNMGRTALHYSYGLRLTNSECIRDRLLASGANLETRDVRMRMPKYYNIFSREIEQIRRIELELN